MFFSFKKSISFNLQIILFLWICRAVIPHTYLFVYFQYGTIIPFYDDLLNDPSRIVRNSAYELIGLLIYATRRSRFQKRGRSRALSTNGNGSLKSVLRERTRSEETSTKQKGALTKVKKKNELSDIDFDAYM